MRILFELLFLGISFSLVSGNTLLNETPSSGYFDTTYHPDSDSISKYPAMDIRPFGLKIVPPASGVRFYKKGILYMSEAGKEGRIPSDHVSFGSSEACYSYLSDTTLINKTLFSTGEIFNYPCEAVTFNADYTVMYFTAKIKKKIPEQIYEAKHETTLYGESKWVSDFRPLPFCNNKSVFTHPALSADGQMIVYASETSGSIGGLDLFVSRREGSSWSDPEHLGDRINTAGNEHYPFLDAGNNLFFSSDRTEGEGGYDIYVCRYNGTAWDKPVNTGDYINTPNDEIAFSINPENGRNAFFTSRDNSAREKEQLYMISFTGYNDTSYLTNLSETMLYNAYGEIAGREAPGIMTAATDPALTIKKDVPSVTAKPSPLPEPEKKSSAEPAKTKKQAEPKIEISQTPVTEPLRTEKPAESKAETQKAAAPPTEPVKTENPPDNKTAIPQIVAPVTESAAKKDAVVYRIQYKTNDRSIGSGQITIGGKIYPTYEYLHAGAYRSCAGEFLNLDEARTLQRIIRKEGFPDAFVVAFRNNERTMDPALFR